jgi:hypothetical protein
MKFFFDLPIFKQILIKINKKSNEIIKKVLNRLKINYIIDKSKIMKNLKEELILNLNMIFLNTFN